MYADPEAAAIIHDGVSVTCGEQEARLPHRVDEIEAPDAVAVVFGDEALSYAELNRLAHHLRERV